MLKICIIFFVAFTQISFGQIEEVRRITRTLCDSSMHGRGYVFKGDSIAAEFIAAEFKQLGLEPYHGSYFQRYTIESVNTFPGRVDFFQNGVSLEAGKQFILDPACPSADIKLKVRSLSIHEILDENILISAVKEGMESNRINALLLDFRDVTGETLKQVQGLSQSLATYLPIIEVTSNKFTWSVSSHQLTNPLIYLQSEAYNGAEEFELFVDASELKKYPTQNVLALLPGKKKCKKTIVFSAHYDHLGRMGMNTYFPGANDNASGTAMLLSMAKYFKENPSPYNIMFIAFSGEEAGLLGSKFYVENPIFPLKSIKFLVNLDIMGSGEDGVTVVNGSLFEKEFNLLQQINQENDLLKRVKKRGPAANSDHYWFTEKGVPAFFIYTEGLNKNYHDVFDVYDELTFVEY